MRYLLIVLLFFSCQKDDLILPKPVETKSEPKFTVVPYKYKPIVDTTVTQYLSTPASGSKLIVPVVIIDIIPTDTNGVLLENAKNSLQSFGNKVVDDLDKDDIFNWCLNNNEKTKFAIEESSKFRGYNNSNETPYVGIKVIKHFKVHDLPLIWRKNYTSNPDSIHVPNYFKLFDSIGLKDLVENGGVKEVWINYPSYVKNFYVYESNMSSPYGDVSNSYRDPDLPVYNKTYVVYGNSMNRWFAEMIHCRGHQIEAQLGFVDRQFFWTKFASRSRCGDTHHTPNSTYAYDYDNSTPVLSDITDWNPDGGNKISVNKDNWRKVISNTQISTKKTKSHGHWNSLIDNNICVDPQSAWLVYWFQSIPSNKTITFGNNTVTNWWDIFYNWDDAMKNKKKLYN